MRPRHQLVDRSNVASCVMMDDQISVSGKYLSSILHTMIYMSLFYHCFDFRYGSFVRFVDLIETIASFASRQVSYTFKILVSR